MTLILVGTATVASALAFVFAWLTWRRVLARRALLLSLAGIGALLLLSGLPFGGTQVGSHPVSQLAIELSRAQAIVQSP